VRRRDFSPSTVIPRWVVAMGRLTILNPNLFFKVGFLIELVKVTKIPS